MLIQKSKPESFARIGEAINTRWSLIFFLDEKETKNQDLDFRTRWLKDWKIEWLKNFDLQKQLFPEVLEFGPEASGFIIGIFFLAFVAKMVVEKRG